MTSALGGRKRDNSTDKLREWDTDREELGVQKSKNVADVIFEGPLAQSQKRREKATAKSDIRQSMRSSPYMKSDILVVFRCHWYHLTSYCSVTFEDLVT